MKYYRACLLIAFFAACSAPEDEQSAIAEPWLINVVRTLECTMDDDGRYECRPVDDVIDADATLSNDANSDPDQNARMIDASVPLDAESASAEDAQTGEQTPSRDDQGVASISDDAANSRDLTDAQIGLVGPVLPAEAGHRAATIFRHHNIHLP